jgi:hypothetical protein
MLIRCSLVVAGVARVTFRKPWAIDVAAKLTTNPITKSKAVSSPYTIVIHPMEAPRRFRTKDKVSYRSLVVAMKAPAEPNQPAAGCR